MISFIDSSKKCELDLDVLFVEDYVSKELILSTWKGSYNHRNNILYKGKTFSEIVATFRILKSSLGVELVITLQTVCFL